MTHSSPTADYWIDLLQLIQHPEGGYYREIYRAEESITTQSLPARYSTPRAFSTSIYFLLKAGYPSKFHRLQSDELWHYYAGSSVIIHMIDDQGNYTCKVLGSDYTNKQAFVQIIPRHTWFAATVDAATVDTPESFVLIGCTVAPGFDFHDFELARRDYLLTAFPQHAGIIHLLT
ncbi:MAG: cupin domain-containing protein [Bacteroidota bacterium]